MSRKRRETSNNFASKNSKSPDRSGAVDEGISLKDILKTKWKVFRSSPLYNFDDQKLKLYGKKLTEELNSKKKFTSNINYKCRFVINENIRPNNQSLGALQVEITTVQSHWVYLGYFISWDVMQDNQDSISLPILLTKGREIPAVHSSLCKIFDCDIQPVTFSFSALTTFFAKLLETPRKDMEKECLSLEYKIPGCEIKDNIKVQLSVQDTLAVLLGTMQSLKETNQGIADGEIIDQFYNKIMNHLHGAYQMDLTLAELHKVIFPDGFISSDGEVKMSTDDVAINALIVLHCFTPLNAVTNFRGF